LNNGTPYTFKVVATNTSGSSAPSGASVTATPVGAPDVPTGVTGAAGNAQVVVSWTAGENGGSAITGFKAMAVSDTTKSCSTTGALTCTITGLTNGIAYTFVVKATNAIGTSAASAASIAVTPVKVPGAPTIATVVGATGQVTVTWTAPADSGGTHITGYKVKAVSDTTKSCSTSGALTCVVAGLVDTAHYSFTVTATNAVGVGTASTPSNTVTNIRSAYAREAVSFHRSGSSLLIRLPEFSGTAQVSVMDIWGRMVWNKTVNSGMREVSWQHNSSGVAGPGLYIVRVIAQDAGHKTRVTAESKVMITP
jgi:hypothetical protein